MAMSASSGVAREQVVGSSRSLRILWVKVGGLWPINTGGRLRSFHTIAELARRHRVTVMTTHGSHEQGDELARNLPDCDVQSLQFNAVKSRSWRFPWAVLCSWFSRLPVDLHKYRNTALREKVRAALDSGEYDLCIADFLTTVPNVPMNTKTPVVFFSHNVEYMIWRRLCRNDSNPVRKLLLALEWRKMRRCEIDACRSAQLTLAVSEDDRRRFVADGKDEELAQRIHSIATGVDIDFFQPRPDIPMQPDTLVFTGSMDWHPNEDAMLYFIDEILPRVRRVVPSARLTIVGRNPSARLRSAADSAGVTVTGTVADIRYWVAEAAVYIVPLRIGGGTRLKIYEALAMGKAVVSTTIGAEGLPLSEGQEILRADEPEVFAARTVRLLRDAQERDRLGSAGRELMEKHFSWSSVAADFESHCRRAVEDHNEPGWAAQALSLSSTTGK